MLSSRALRIKHRRTMPPRLGRVAAHALGDKAQTRCAPRFGRQLQTPPGGEADRCGDFQYDHRDGAIPQRLFGHGERVGLVPGLGENKAGRITPFKSCWKKLLWKPMLADPDHIATVLSGHTQCKAERRRAGCLMHTRGPDWIGCIKCERHGQDISKWAGKAQILYHLPVSYRSCRFPTLRSSFTRAAIRPPCSV